MPKPNNDQKLVTISAWGTKDRENLRKNSVYDILENGRVDPESIINVEITNRGGNANITTTSANKARVLDAFQTAGYTADVLQAVKRAQRYDGGVFSSRSGSPSSVTAGRYFR